VVPKDIPKVLAQIPTASHAKFVEGIKDRWHEGGKRFEWLGSEFGIALRRTLGSLLVTVAGGVAPTIVVVVVKCEQVFDPQGTRVDAMSSPEMALNFLEAGRPIAVHIPPRARYP
jgi:hypothetical protein